MRRRTLLVAAGAAVVATALVAPARPAAAHPLGNLTVNTYAGIVVRDDEITVDYVFDLAELPTVQAMQRIDLDGDGELGPTEAARLPGRRSAHPCSTDWRCRSAGDRSR